jgi:hypothetical protein
MKNKRFVVKILSSNHQFFKPFNETLRNFRTPALYIDLSVTFLHFMPLVATAIEL